MPRMRSTRRPLFRKRKLGPRRKRYGRRYKKSPATGRLFVVRKVQELHSSYNSAGSPTPYLMYEGNNSVTFGSPVSTNIPGCYDVPFSIQFRLDELTSYTEFSTLFDRYRINSCKVKVQTTLATGTQVTTPPPFIDYITDHDDASLITPSEMREKMGVKTKYFTGARQAITMGCKPVPANLIYNSGVFNAYGVPKKSPFINMTNTGVPHYAIKGILRNIYLNENASSPLTWDISYGVVLKDIQ